MTMTRALVFDRTGTKKSRRILNKLQSLEDLDHPSQKTIRIYTTVARERRRGDRPPTKNVIWGIYIWSMWGDKEFVVS